MHAATGEAPAIAPTNAGGLRASCVYALRVTGASRAGFVVVDGGGLTLIDSGGDAAVAPTTAPDAVQRSREAAGASG